MHLVFLVLFALSGVLTACDDECILAQTRCQGSQVQECKKDDHLGMGVGGKLSDPTLHNSWQAIFLCPEGSSCDPDSLKCMTEEPRPECEALPNQTGETCIENWKATCVNGYWDRTPAYEIGSIGEGRTDECLENYICLEPASGPEKVICALGGEPVPLCEGAEAEGNASYFRCLDAKIKAECYKGYQIATEPCAACLALEDGTICCAGSFLIGCP